MSQSSKPPITLDPKQLEPRRGSLYPEPFNARLGGREKIALGNPFGLSNFGVNQTRLPPGGRSAMRHAHSKQDEFIYVLEGHPTLVTNAGETPLSPGECAGFPAGSGDAHHLINRSDSDVVYLEIGDRTEGDAVVYPDDDLQAVFTDDGWRFLHKDGTQY